MQPQHTKQAGFTLIEILVALAIFSTAAMAMLNASTAQLRAIPSMQELTYGSFVAQNRLVETRLASPFPELGTRNGRIEMADRDWYWRQQVLKTTDDNFRAIRISVSPDERFDRIVSEVTTYVGKPD